MTTCLDILTRSARYLGITMRGGVPSGTDQAALLEYLQDAINDLPLLLNGEWSDVILTDASAYSASDGERITTAGYAAVITLPTTYENDDGDTVPQLDLSRVQIVGADHEQAGLWVYSASSGSWAQVDALAINDDSPFGAEDTAALAAIVAVSAAAEYGAELPPVTVARASRAINSFRARFYREVPTYVDTAYVLLSDIGHGGLLELPD